MPWEPWIPWIPCRPWGPCRPCEPWIPWIPWIPCGPWIPWIPSSPTQIPVCVTVIFTKLEIISIAQNVIVWFASIQICCVWFKQSV